MASPLDPPQVLVYNFADLRLLHAIETLSNPGGLLALSPSADSAVLACPGLHPGQARCGLSMLPARQASGGRDEPSARRRPSASERRAPLINPAFPRLLLFRPSTPVRCGSSCTTRVAPSLWLRITAAWRRWRCRQTASCWPRRARRAPWCAGLAPGSTLGLMPLGRSWWGGPRPQPPPSRATCSSARLLLSPCLAQASPSHPRPHPLTTQPAGARLLHR